MKWYENVNMLKEILENISKELEEVEYGSREWHLLTDENNLIKNHLELIKENQILKKALDKACARLEWDCPVELDLIDDLDCENCNGTYKECWKKYCLKEVVDNEKD